MDFMAFARKKTEQGAAASLDKDSSWNRCDQGGGSRRSNGWKEMIHEMPTESGFTGVGKCPFLGILSITFKYLLEILSPIVG